MIDWWYYTPFFFSLMTYAVAEISEQQIRDRPLELGDIMPEDRRLYDKMRPPKYKGKINSLQYLKPVKDNKFWHDVVCYLFPDMGV